MRNVLKAATIAIATTVVSLGFAGAAHAQSLDGPIRTVQVQKKKKTVAKRAPTRIIVRPTLRYRLDATEFPRTDNLGFPGPNAVRQCVSWLAPEYRPSGTVVVPRMRCWWERG